MFSRSFALLVSLCLLFNALPAAEPEAGKQASQARTLFDFNGEKDLSRWQIVNDGVMGGRSTSRVQLQADVEMKF